MAAIFSIPTAAISAVQSVPYLTFNLNSVALLISVGLAFLVTPVVLFVGLQCVWTAAIGPARKTLTSLFIVALSPVLPALASVALALLWAVLGLFVMAFIVVLPLVLTVLFLISIGESANKWKTEQANWARLHPLSASEDITFSELGLALVVAFVSACTTAPVVAAWTLLKSPLVFLCVSFASAKNALSTLFKAVCGDCCWLAPFVPILFAFVLAFVVVVVATGTAFSVLLKVLASVLWPGYVACGWLRYAGARRQQRAPLTVLKQAGQAAYQVFWFSDIVTNAAILMDPDLVSKATAEITALATGTRQELSSEVKRVSCLPPVIIGVLDQRDGAWRLEVQAIATALSMDKAVLEGAWTSFFNEMGRLGRACLDRELLTTEYCEGTPPALLIGLPALVLCAAVARSPTGENALTLANRVTFTSMTRPHGTKFVDEAWSALMEAKKAHERATAEGVLPSQQAMLEAVLLAGGAPLDELPPVLQAAYNSAGEHGELPPLLAAIHRPLYALAYQMAKQPVFKSSFMGLVYDALCDYTPNYAAREQTLI